MSSFPVRSVLFEKLKKGFKPRHIELVNESPNHGLPESAEKHFRLVMVSEAFESKSRIERHRLVNEVVAVELRDHVHAFSIQAFTPAEWEKREGVTFASPECAHGSGIK